MAKLGKFYETFQRDSLRFQYQFEFQIDGPTGEDFSDLVFYATSTKLPGITLEKTDVAFQGITFKVPNNITTFGSPWTLSLRCDSEMKIRGKIEDWISECADLKKGGGGKKTMPTYKANVYLLNSNLDTPNYSEGNPNTAEYVLEGIFPISIGDSSLDTSSSELATMDVEFEFQYWYKGNSSNDPLTANTN